MTREEVRARIAEIGIIRAVRVYSESEAMFAAEAIGGGGRTGDWRAPDSPKCNQASPAGVDPRTGAAVHEHGERRARAVGDMIRCVIGSGE